MGYSTVKTNLWTVAPNCVGFVVLLCFAKSSDYFRERGFHIAAALSISLVGMIILASIDALENKGVAYFACFLMASGAYIPSVLVHSWYIYDDWWTLGTALTNTPGTITTTYRSRQGQPEQVS